MAVLASTATPVNSCRIWLWISCGTITTLAISAETVSSSCSSRCFMTWAAASRPMMTRSVANFCTFVILETSSEAVWVSAGAGIMSWLVALVGAGQPRPDGLRHVGGVFFDESVEDFDGHHPGLSLVAPAIHAGSIRIARLASDGVGWPEGHAEGDVAGGSFFEQLE